MKLKLRAEPKDWIIFGVFAVFLLYFSCIAVLNLSTFASTGTFHGFNPFPAFSKDFFAPTMVLFIGIVIALLMSVSSHFFDRQKGIGFSSDAKKEKNYARWATDKEMKKELNKIDPFVESNDAGGIPLIMNKKGVWVDNGGYHNLIIGSTGAGKTQTTVLPMVKNLSKHDESMIITDPKGEIYEETAEMLKERGYNIILLNFRDPQQGNSWNPLALPYRLYQDGNTDKATEILDDLALNILYDESSKGQDPFWEKTSADYFAGISQALFEDATEEQINLNSINLMTTIGEDKFMGTTYIKEYFSYKEPTSAAYINASSTINAPNETKGSILSVFRQKIKLFATRDNLSEMLSRSDFDMKDIGRKKTAVFIVIQDEKKTYHSLVTIFLKQCYETLISVAQESGGKLPHRTNFILDEFANMPPLKDVTTMVTAARSRNIRFNFIIQNFAQLYDVYGKENGETIKGNCGNIVYLISSEISALEEISKMCGDVKSGEKDKTASMPLVTVSDLQRLKMWDIIVLRIRMMPFKTSLTPNFEMDWGKHYPKATYPSREKKKVEVFDLKKLVEEKKEAKMRELLGSAPPGMGGMNPFGMPSRPPGMPTGMMNGMPGMGQIPPTGMMPGISSPMNQGMSASVQTPAPPQLPPFPAMDTSMQPPSFPNPDLQNPGSGGFDVDDLIKRIDAKIAALEEEERQEKLKEQKSLDTPVGAEDLKIAPSTLIDSGNTEAKDTIYNYGERNQSESILGNSFEKTVPVHEKGSMHPIFENPIIEKVESKIEPQQPVVNPIPPIPMVEEGPVEKIEEKPAIVPVPFVEANSIPQEEPVRPSIETVPPSVEVKPAVIEVNEPVVPQKIVSIIEKKEPNVEILPKDIEEKIEAIDEYITDDQFFDDFFNDEDE